MRIPAAIYELLDGKAVASSRLTAALAEELLSEHLLAVSSHGSRKSYRAIDTAALRDYLVRSNEDYRILDVDADEISTRADQAVATGNSKLVAVRSCPGFLVNSYDAIAGTLLGREFVVAPQEGSFVFVSDWQTFTIPQDVVVVGIENMENFRQIRRQRSLFDEWLQSTFGHVPPVLFVSRYPQSLDLRHWLESIPNHYVHFGDFDLAGIHIFETEFRGYLPGRSSFLIPSDIESRIAEGSLMRYDSQLSRFGHLVSSDSDIQHLIDMIHQYHRCYDQEGYIRPCRSKAGPEDE